MDGKIYWHSAKNNNGRNVACIGNEKPKNIKVLKNLQERQPLGKPERRRDRG